MSTANPLKARTRANKDIQATELVVDQVNHPPHYTQGSIECIDAMEAMLGRDGFIAYLRGSIMKYNWRLLNKAGPAEDAAKLAWYNNRLLQVLNDESV